MESILYKNAQPRKPQEGRLKNIENGNDAEVFSASILLKAIGAEVSWGSRNEDGRKIDLICSYDHPWIEKERLIFLVQVKSGSTFGREIKKGFKLFSAAKSAALRTSHPIFLIWINRTTNKAYWAYIHPFSSKESQVYGENHLINPATKYDIARCQSKFIPGKSDGAGIILKKVKGDLKTKRTYSLGKYKTLQNIRNPNLGEVECTRIGWRHMFRKSRSSKVKEKSLIVIPYLKKILEQKASKIYVSYNSIDPKDDMYEIRTSEYVLHYDKIKIYEDETHHSVQVIVRLHEEIMWPKNWDNNAMLSQQIERRVVLKSAYYK